VERSPAEQKLSDERMAALRKETTEQTVEEFNVLEKGMMSAGLDVSEAKKSIQENKRETRTEDPAEIAKSAMSRYYSVFNAALNHGTLHPEMQQDLVDSLRKAKTLLETGQHKNWDRIKKVEQILETATQEPEEALTAYANEVNVEKLNVRHSGLENKLTKVNALVEELSQKLTQEYGISPEEIVAGGSPKGFAAKTKFWMRRLTGSQQLLEEWRTARATEDELTEELRAPTQGQDVGRGTAKAAARRTERSVQEQQIQQDRLAAQELRERSKREIPKHGFQLEREYLKPEEDVSEILERARPNLRRPSEAAPAEEESYDVDLSELEEKEEVSGVRERVRPGLRRPSAPPEEVLGAYQAEAQSKQQVKAARPAKQNEDVLSAYQTEAQNLRRGKEAEAVNERRFSMTIDRAQKVVPNAARLWDFATEQLAKHPDAALAFSNTSEWTGKGVEQNPATNYVYTIAKWQEAVLNNDKPWADEMMKRIKEMNKALHISESNALYQSVFAEKGHAKVQKEAIRAVQRNKNRSKRIARDIGQGSI